MKKGAFINQGYGAHKLLLMKNLLIIEDISNNAFKYLNPQSGYQLENYMYSRLLEYL